MTAVGILGLTAMMAIAAFRLPSKLPDRYNSAYFKMSKPWLFSIAVIAVVSSLGFVFLVLTELPVVGLVYLGVGPSSLLCTTFYVSAGSRGRVSAGKERSSGFPGLTRSEGSVYDLSHLPGGVLSRSSCEGRQPMRLANGLLSFKNVCPVAALLLRNSDGSIEAIGDNQRWP